MTEEPVATSGFWALLTSGGTVMLPLIVCSLAAWVVILERAWRFHRLTRDLEAFQLEAMGAMARGNPEVLRALCGSRPLVPTSRLLLLALDRLSSQEPTRWQEAVERKRQLVNQDLKSHLWILGTIASVSPFIGLFGTVVGILGSFKQMAVTGSGGFAIVAGGISEALIATAGGILVAVVALVFYNFFQTRAGALTLLIRVHTEELLEVLESRRAGHGA